MRWHRSENSRDLPWKGEKDPYKIWVSELMLQQTQAAQVRPYYERFLTAFPSVQALATAAESAVFKLWEGLGYYSRCRHLMASAQVIMTRHQGHFPRTYAAILALKGIGPYTAAAIASFAFDLPYAVVDGNVYRVLTRYRDLSVGVDTTTGRKQLNALAQELLDKAHPAAYNQAIMDFGAQICMPALPQCTHCFLESRCLARQRHTVALRPVKEKKIAVQSRKMSMLCIVYRDKIILKKRSEKDIWQGLHSLVALEETEELSVFLKRRGLEPEDYTITPVAKEYKQRLTHRWVYMRFIEVYCRRAPGLGAGEFWQPESALKEAAFPKIFNDFLKDKYGACVKI